MGDLILGAILQYMISAVFSCFLWSVKGYKQALCFSMKRQPFLACRSSLPQTLRNRNGSPQACNGSPVCLVSILQKMDAINYFLMSMYLCMCMRKTSHDAAALVHGAGAPSASPPVVSCSYKLQLLSIMTTGHSEYSVPIPAPLGSLPHYRVCHLLWLNHWQLVPSPRGLGV